jgi:rhodanese-related sulfurtransferase
VKELERFKEKPVIVSCATGNRSGSAAAVLRKHGFTNVVNLAGGIAAWQQAGLPTGK